MITTPINKLQSDACKTPYHLNSSVVTVTDRNTTLVSSYLSYFESRVSSAFHLHNSFWPLHWQGGRHASNTILPPHGESHEMKPIFKAGHLVKAINAITRWRRSIFISISRYVRRSCSSAIVSLASSALFFCIFWTVPRGASKNTIMSMLQDSD